MFWQWPFLPPQLCLYLPEQYCAALCSHCQVYELISIQVQPSTHTTAKILQGGGNR